LARLVDETGKVMSLLEAMPPKVHAYLRARLHVALTIQDNNHFDICPGFCLNKRFSDAYALYYWFSNSQIRCGVAGIST
jgi:hypothetical protein